LTNFVFIAVKDFRKAKGRLQLPGDLKIELCRSMFFDVRSTLQSASHVDKVVVISSEKSVLNDLPVNFSYLFEETPNGLNYAIMNGIKSCSFSSKDSLLILPSDIPLITSEDVDFFFQQALHHDRSVLVSPSRRRDGTNALLLKPPTIMTPSFGNDSFSRHLETARSLPDVYVEVVARDNIALDIDTLEDLLLLRNINSDRSSCHFARSIKIST